MWNMDPQLEDSPLSPSQQAAFETHGSNCIGEVLPLTGDVGNLELELSSGEPGVRSLRPKFSQLDLALPLLLLLLLMYTGSLAAAHHPRLRWQLASG